MTGPVVAQVGQLASSYSNTATIQNISLSITGAPSPAPPAGPGATFTGKWLVTLNPATLVRPLLPVSVATTLTVDTTNPTAAVISGCNGTGGGTGGGNICGLRMVECSNGGGAPDYDSSQNGGMGYSIPCQGITLSFATCVTTNFPAYLPGPVVSNMNCPTGYHGSYVWAGDGPSGWGVYHVFCVSN